MQSFLASLRTPGSVLDPIISGLDFSVSRDTDFGSIVVGLPGFVFGLP